MIAALTQLLDKMLGRRLESFEWEQFNINLIGILATMHSNDKGTFNNVTSVSPIGSAELPPLSPVQPQGQQSVSQPQQNYGSYQQPPVQQGPPPPSQNALVPQGRYSPQQPSDQPGTVPQGASIYEGDPFEDADAPIMSDPLASE